MEYRPITGYTYTKEKGYNYIDPVTGEIVYGTSPPPLGGEPLEEGHISWDTPAPVRKGLPPSAVKTIEYPEGYRTDYGDFQIEFVKEIDVMKLMANAMFNTNKANANGEPVLIQYAEAELGMQLQDIFNYKREVESSLDIIFQKPWLSNREKWDIFQQAKAKIRKPIAMPEEVPAIRPQERKTYEDLIRQIQLYDRELSIFAENADINPGWGRKIVPVALVNAKTRDPIREASPEESAYFHSVKAKRAEVMKRINEMTPTGAVRPVPSAPVTQETQELPPEFAPLGIGGITGQPVGAPDKYRIGQTVAKRGKTYKYIGNNQWQEL